jgi:FkbM family methyltransferase
VRLPIVRGALRGCWWDPASRGKVLRVLAGTYEPEQTRRFLQSIRPGETVLDVGAHVGYYALLAARRVGASGTVVAFEPDPRNGGFLARHAAVNGCGNVRIERAAVAGQAGTARFAAGSGSGTGHLAAAGALEVPVVTLDGYCGEHGLAPAAIKIDVEGAELQVLRGGERTLAEHRPRLFLSTHGPEVHAACLAHLRDRGYAVDPILGGDVEATTELYAAPAPAEPTP